MTSICCIIEVSKSAGVKVSSGGDPFSTGTDLLGRISALSKSTLVMLAILFILLAFAILISVVLVLMAKRQKHIMNLIIEILEGQKADNYSQQKNDQNAGLSKENSSLRRENYIDTDLENRGSIKTAEEDSSTLENTDCRVHDAQSLVESKKEKDRTSQSSGKQDKRMQMYANTTSYYNAGLEKSIRNDLDLKPVGKHKDDQEREVSVINSVSVNGNIHFLPQSPVSFKEDKNGMMNLLSDKTVVPNNNCFSNFVKTAFFSRYDFFYVYVFLNRDGIEVGNCNQIRLLRIQEPAKVKIEQGSIVLIKKGSLIVEEK